MWPRVTEAVLGAWLLASPFLLGAPSADATWVPQVLGLGVLLVAWRSREARLLHFLVVAVALALIAWGWARFPRPGPPIAQNAIVTGLVLGLTGIIPNHAADPPPGWRPFVREGEQ